MIGRLMKSVISMFTSNEKIDEIEEFCKKNPIDSAKRAVEQGTKKFLNFRISVLEFLFFVLILIFRILGLETARLTANWLARDGEEIKAYLS